ncbi:MAG: tyrosine-type recombinase/integrase [Planctomycetes bacterium]|nr:tyrosine-type recombinase/integrase [Planctomycetota bacterium]
MTTFATWATGTVQPSPELALRVLVAAGRAGARGMVCAWRDELLAAGKASSTVAGMLSALVSVVTAARLAGLVEWALERVAPKVEPRLDRSGPQRLDVARLLDHLDGLDDDRAVRDAAIVRLLHGAALRLNEVCTLRFCDLALDADGGAAVLALRKGHTERERMLVGELAAASLRRWLDRRGAAGPDAPLFVAVRRASEEPITGRAIERMLATRAKEAGIRATIRPHGLRHSAASHVARGGSLAQLKRLGGWSTLTSPARYLDRVDADRRTAVALAEV